MNSRIAVILGIRPDVIRASLLLHILSAEPDCDVRFIWTGQHYSDNLKDIFFRELNVRRPDIELNAGGDSDAAVVANVISSLHPVLTEIRPAAAVFLGDTNSVMGCIAAAQQNIPVVHIEGCMRSYDWRMPEEKYRTIIDHVSDVIYAYLHEYKNNGIAEGLNPKNIVVVGNPIVDVLNTAYRDRKSKFDALATSDFFSSRHIRRSDYYLMTCHRRENVGTEQSLKNVFCLAANTSRPVFFPASYRTQREMRAHGIPLPANVIVVDPVGYEEFLVLMVNSLGVLTDSGTVVEEACILRVPSVQMRRSTERPQVYDVGASVKFDPSSDEITPRIIIQKLEALHGRSWNHPFGDGQSSRRIAEDLLRRIREDSLHGHRREDYPINTAHAYREDGLATV